MQGRGSKCKISSTPLISVVSKMLATLVNHSHSCIRYPMAHRFGKGLIGHWQQWNDWLSSQQPNYFTLCPRLLTIPRCLFGWCNSFKKRRQRKYLDSSLWLKDQRCEGVVQHAWEEGLSLGADYILGKCIKTC